MGQRPGDGGAKGPEFVPKMADSGLAFNLRMDNDIGLRTDCGSCKMTTTLGTAAQVYGKYDDRLVAGPSPK